MESVTRRPHLSRIMLVAMCVLVLAALDQGHGFRLSREVVPEVYTVKIITDLGSNGDFSFEGEVWIEVLCRNSTDTITLHAKELEILEENVTVTDNIVTSQERDNATDWYVLRLSKLLDQGHKYTVHIPFKGKLQEGLSGYYRSSYVDRASKQKRWLAVTHFEPLDARRAFPCFDEPSFKARFTVIMGRKKGLKSVSNMPLNFTEPMKERAGWEWDHYKISQRMSTYLVAFMVSDFEFRESALIPGANNVAFRIWSRKDALPQTEYAGEVGPKVLHFFEKFFDTEYPLPKQDMAAIPDFSAGAMENWGLITYRETALLYEPNVTSTSQKQSLTNTIAHELAHQWFGNLVTMKWFNELWLNEGFATYVATLGVHELEPKWRSVETDAVSNLLRVFSFDSKASSHPVNVRIDDPSKISQIFDAISYSKGSFLLRMMSLFLGEDVFRQGVTQYLSRHKFDNAEQDDLWQSLTEAAHKAGVLPQDLTVKKVMDTWTLQTGYPLLSVARDYEAGTAKVTQSHYLSHKVKMTTDDNCWVVPLTYSSQTAPDFENTKPKSWMFCNTTHTEVTGLPSEDNWVIFNHKFVGLYRVNYDERNWDLISRTLNSDNYKSIGLLSRVLLLEDAMTLARTGDLSYNTSLRLLNYMKQEAEYLPWLATSGSVNELDRLLRRSLGYDLFRKYTRELFSSMSKKISNIEDVDKGDNVHELFMHNLLVGRFCSLEIGTCVDQARTLFRKWTTASNPDTENPIPSDIRSVVYCAAIRYGGEKEWDFAWERYLNSNVGTEKGTLLSALSCTRERWLLNRYLHWSIDEKSGIRKQDSSTVFSAVASNDAGFDLAKDFLYQNIHKLYKHYGQKAGRLSRYVTAISSRMSTEKDLKELEKFTTDNSEYLKYSTLSVKQALETVRTNIQWHEKQYNSFLDTLKSLL